jgi:Ser/Thr protein kinase RdoA (MazF antagonist)
VPKLLDAYSRLSFQLPAGLIHGDAWRGNLLRDRHRVVLADWDTVSTGPREIDLIPTLQAPRFGLPAGQRDAFITAYGHDIRSRDGYQVLHDIRELSTLTALLRDGHVEAAVQRELRTRPDCFAMATASSGHRFSKISSGNAGTARLLIP